MRPRFGGLLLQFRHHQRLLLSEDLDQERLGVWRGDAPRLQMLWPEVTKIEGDDDRCRAVHSGASNPVCEAQGSKCDSPDGMPGAALRLTLEC